MAVKLKKSGKGEYKKAFRASHAVVIGINDYSSGIQPLTTPVNDATRLAEQLAEEHGYTMHLLVEDVSKVRLKSCFTEELPPQIGEDDRLLVYFAGHGVALDGEDGPQGFLVPQDADAADRDSFLPMIELHAWLTALECRHMLAILDCCFAGAFRWAATRSVDVLPEVIHQERFERYLISPAWQVLTSAAYDQRALDVVANKTIGARGVREEGGEKHSPFALALYKALRGEGDLIPKGDGDGVITATELYLYLREEVEIEADVKANHEQTPGLWPLNKHEKGEYIFLTPGHELNLPPAPELTYERNPWRGLKSYDEKHRELFFGRDQEIRELAAHVREEPFTSVLGASGTGKSSLVKAGLLPHLAEENGSWLILSPLRPGATPLNNLRELLATDLSDYGGQAALDKLQKDAQTLADIIAAWAQGNPDSKLLLVVDQLEELLTLARDAERKQFLALLANAIEKQPEVLRLVTTLRTDFEPQFNADSPLAEQWRDARYVVPPMNQADLRQVIKGPATVRVLYFEPPELVDKLITEVIQTPGALPLLSFTLSEMYIHYLKSGRDNRALTHENYEALDGVIGSLRTRANEEYESLPDDAHRETMERVMLRMISVEGGELTRRRVQRSELVYSDTEENARVDGALDSLVEARLLVTGEEDGEPVVEPAHDALVRGWDKLLMWRREAEDYLPLQRRLTQAAVDWDQAVDEKDKKELLWHNNPRLPQLQRVLEESNQQNGHSSGFVASSWQAVFPSVEIFKGQTWLNGRETAFVEQSILQKGHNLRRLLATVTGVITALSILLILAFLLWRQSETNLAEAQRQERISRAGELAAQVQEGAIEENPQRSLLLGIEALRVTADEGEPPVPEAEQAIRQALNGMSGIGLGGHGSVPLSTVHRVGVNAGSSVRTAAISPDSRWAVTGGSDGTVQIWDLTQPTAPPTVLQAHNFRVESITFGPENRWLLTGSHDGGWDDWDLRAWDMLALQNDPAVFPDTIKRFVHNADGQWLVTVHADQSLQVWDMSAPGNDPILLADPIEAVSEVLISPDNEWIVASNEQGSVQIYSLDALDKSPITITNDDVEVETLKISPDSRWLLVETDQGLRLWKLANPAEELLILEDKSWENRAAVTMNSDGQRLAAVIDQEIALWDMNDPETVPLMLTGHQANIERLAFSPNDMWLVSIDAEETIRVWDLSQPTSEPVVLTGHTDVIDELVISPDSRWLVSEGWDNSIRIWSLDDLTTEPVVINDHVDDISALHISPDSRWLLSGSDDNTARLWDLGQLHSQSSAAFVPLTGQFSQAVETALSQDGHWLATVYQDNSIQLWDMTDLSEPAMTLLPTGFDIERVALGVDNSWLVLTSPIPDSTDATTYLWNLTDSSSLPIALPGQEGRATTFAISPDQRWLATADGDQFFTPKGESHSPINQVLLWDMANLEDGPSHLKGPTGLISKVLISPDNRLLIATSLDNSAYVWELADLETLPAVFDHGFSINSAAISPDSRWLATGSGDPYGVTNFDDTSTRLWDLTNLTNDPITLAGSTGEIGAIRFSPDGQWIASGGLDTIARVWKTSDLSASPLILAGHGGSVDNMDFSPDGQKLVTGGTDDTVRVWNLADERSKGSIFPKLPGNISAVTITPDGKWLMIQGDWGTIQLWPLQVETLIERACQTVGRNLTFGEWALRFSTAPYHLTCPDLPLHQSFISEARVLADAGAIDAAMDQYQLALEMDPRLTVDPGAEIAEFVVVSGVQKAWDGNSDEALELFRQAAQYNPEAGLDPEEKLKQVEEEIAADDFYEKGQALAQAGDVEQAAEMFAEAVRLDPDNTFDPQLKAKQIFDKERASELHGEAIALAKEGSVSEALRKYQQALSLDPTHNFTWIEETLIRLLVSQGDADLENQDYEQAIDNYSKAIDLGASRPQIYRNRGFAYLKQELYEEATDDFNEAMDHLEPSAWLYDTRGDSYLMRDLYELAIADYDAAIQMPDNSDTRASYVKRGRARLALGQIDGAIADYEEAIALDPGNPWIHNSLCWFGSLAGEAETVLENCEQAVSLVADNESAGIRDSRGIAYALSGNVDGAIADFQFFIDNNKDSSGTRQEWVDRLKAGEDPVAIFSAETLAMLRDE